MRPHRLVAVGLAAAVLAAGGAVGFTVGKSKAPTTTDASRDKGEAYGLAFKNAFETSFSKSLKAGSKLGTKRGQKSGDVDGKKFGSARGGSAAQNELDLIAAEQARLAAEAEAAERAANCGHVLFVDGACPSDAEVQYEEDAESYCGGGDYETAAALGIEC